MSSVESTIVSNANTVKSSMSSSTSSVSTQWGNITDDDVTPTIGVFENLSVTDCCDCSCKSSTGCDTRKEKPSKTFHPFQRFLRRPPNTESILSLPCQCSVMSDCNIINNNFITDKYITDNVILTDTQNNLKLYHYIHCDESSDDSVKSSRGVIRNGDDIVCKTFGFTSEVLSSEEDSIRGTIHSFDQCKVYDAEEGATLRLYFHDNRWHLSTHRKIDAYRSRWGSSSAKSFGEMFIDALDWEVTNGTLNDIVKYENKSELFNRYCDTLDRNKNYTYLVRNSKDNRIVCDAPSHPTAFFIGSFDRSSHLLIEGNDSGFNTPNLVSFESVDNMIAYVNGLDHTVKQGVIVYMPNQTQIKIMNPTYVNYFNARGNEPSIKFRYLQVRTDKEQVSMLYLLYPELIPVFEKYENIISNIARKIYRAYVNRFINRQYVSLPQPEYFVMQSCHNWHTQDRIANKISYNKVLEIIDAQKPTSINRMIKLYMSTNGKSSTQ